eukprot:scaffold92751_cov28-Tisochrysis_lutea.AAC.2
MRRASECSAQRRPPPAAPHEGDPNSSTRDSSTWTPTTAWLMSGAAISSEMRPRIEQSPAPPSPYPPCPPPAASPLNIAAESAEVAASSRASLASNDATCAASRITKLATRVAELAAPPAIS